MKMKFQVQQISWISSWAATIVAAMGGGVFLFSTMSGIPKTPSLNDEQKAMQQRKIMLRARIELCAMRDRGELPENSTQCDETERQNLQAYEKEISDIESQLRRGVTR